MAHGQHPRAFAPKHLNVSRGEVGQPGHVRGEAKRFWSKGSVPNVRALCADHLVTGFEARVDLKFA